MIIDNIAPNVITASLKLNEEKYLFTGGVGASSFLIKLDLSEKEPVVSVLVPSFFSHRSVEAMLLLLDGTILIGGGTSTDGRNSFIMKVSLTGGDSEVQTTEIASNFAPAAV